MINYTCVVCGNETKDHYMIVNEVWYNEAGFTLKDNCHLKCLQNHLNRNLTIADFVDAPINKNIESRFLTKL